MPPDDITDEIEDMDAGSSAASDLDVAADAVSAEAAPASSSAATDETEASSLSVVRDVVAQREAEQAEAAPSAEGDEAGEAADGTQPTEQDNEEFSDVPFHKHPRFQQLVRERNELRGDSTEYRKITSFMERSGLSADEAANGLNIMALAKLDPVAAWKELKPFVQSVLIAAGEVLPDDLDKRVKAGELTVDVAKEMSRLRAGEKSRSFREQFQQERGVQQKQVELGRALKDTAATWEADRKLKDPNFNAKLPRIQEKIAFLHATEGMPTTVEGVKDQLKRVYEAVNKELAPVVAPVRQQARPAIQPVRGGTVAGNARPEAPSGTRSTLDVIRDELGKRRA